MRKFLLLLLIVSSLPTMIMAQENKEDMYVYCQLVGRGKLYSTKYQIRLDMGQNTKYFFTKNLSLLNDNGEFIKLKSMIDALNFMTTQGWEFTTAYSSFVDASQSPEIFYLLRKKTSELTSDEKAELNKGLNP